jgi:DNA-binding response OmpR family regulator
MLRAPLPPACGVQGTPTNPTPTDRRIQIAMTMMDTWVADRPTMLPDGLFGAGHRVLLAEDDEDMRAFLALMLRRDGFDVIEARNGLELLDHVAPLLAGKDPPLPIDVIITDIQMPCFTGMEILEGLAELRRRPAVVLITAFGDGQTREIARELGAAAVFDKPFDIDALRGVLSTLGASQGSSPPV